jgi:outer membrane protein insertion porin family
MQKRFFLFFLFLGCIFSTITAYSSETVQVLVLPFRINAPADQQRLEREIPSLIQKQLEQEGAVVLEADPNLWTPTTFDTVEKIRETGMLQGADHVIWGSFTRLAKAFSLDVTILETFSQNPGQKLFVEGEGIQQLPAALKKLSSELGIRLFKREKVYKVLVEGNSRIETDAVLRRITTKPGEVFLARSLSQDLKSVYQMGYFEDVKVESEDHPEGKIIVFIIKEKPVIRVIRFKGNNVFDTDELKQTIDLRTGSILNIFTITSNIKRIETQYKEKNYHNAKIEYTVDNLESNQADLTFVIDEGEKTLIRSIQFEGNTVYDDDTLKDLMKTSEKGFFSWLTSSGDLKRENLNQDIAQLTAFYQNNGFIGIRVSDPIILFEDNWIDITIKIEEGPRFKVGKVEISAASEEDFIPSKEELLKKISITKEEYFNREKVRNDILTLTDHYSDEGYAYAEISPLINEDPENLVVDITYTIDKGQQVYFEKIVILGNTKTRDKVIRRELNVYEQELYSGKRLKRGIRNLHRLDYFEDIKADTAKGSSDDSMLLKVEVKEKPTGAFSFGGGYSSTENVFVMASVSQKNLFGRGQVLELKGSLGGRTTQYTLSFTEPWLFDTRVSFGFDLYNWDKDYDDYDKASKGGMLRFGYPVYDYTRLYLSYKYESANVTNIDDDASDSIKELEGENIESSAAVTLRYDSRNRMFNPSEGQNHRLMLQYAGLGGDIAFTKSEAEFGFYIPLFWDTVGFLHAEAGHVEEQPGGILPDYEKYYLGGINSIRGFGWRDIFVRDDDANIIGGNTFIQFNIEYAVPLIEKAGLVGIVFFDTGNVFGENKGVDLSNLRKSAGGGFRWFSPMGPIRLEYGYILDRQEGEDTGKWEFSMGAAF